MIEVRPASSSPAVETARQVTWGNPGSLSGVRSNFDPWLSQMGAVAHAVIDLVRVAAAAYIADRLVSRGTGFSRTMHLHVQLCADEKVVGESIEAIEGLLGWLSGDSWRITTSAEDVVARPDVALPEEVVRFDRVALLSGGLDSLAGACLQTTPTLFVSHTDNPTVSASQKRTRAALKARHDIGSYVSYSLAEASGKTESTTRTRAFLFYAIAVATAASRGIEVVEVPENGFTSLNLPFGNDRGGALSTRSTHPWTMHRLQSIVDNIGLHISVVSPYDPYTKGDLVRMAYNAVDDFGGAAAETLSCAKLDGRTYKGGNPNWNCGLCVACITRRAGLHAAEITDTTPYLATELAGESLGNLRRRRSIDLQAIRSRVAETIDEFTLLEVGPFPDSFDLSRAAELCHRGLLELGSFIEGL